MAEGVHYLPGADPADVAWKLVATNMSDLAAKGAEPIGVLLGYQLGNNDARFLEGLGKALAHFKAALLGGDTISATGAQTLGLTALGRATHCPVPSRAGAQVGDALYLTGPVGAAMLGLEALQKGSGDSSAYRRPKALLAEGQALAPLVTAMMDVSDGLLLDAARLARASAKTLSINSMVVSIATPEHRRAEALRWGDDYQLLFTASPTCPLPVAATQIGEVLPENSAPLLLDNKSLSEADGLGYQHR
jgi:thiamine-monophosphate kinase